ncbi:AfsR/SARP family transcriptional regulator [Streptomyces catenulae]|uniref:BTAD domain-containing putative transcriptional regulator n=1 Tax=Streptomyces catenulae TaxID=66875 RepID=A0ABV2YSC8_9ACTN|nr:AfsR/SARP family transcriptional regulator [Streptomyces catenulae]
MEFRLLGAVSVVTEVGELPLGPAKRRSLLAALLLRPNHPVPVEALTDALWEEPPPRARSVIQGHVSRLRSLLTGAGAAMYGVELVTQGATYILRMPESLLDAHRFEELVALARGQRAAGDAVAMYQEALALWQGPALTGAYRSAPLQAAAHALEELRLTAVELLAGAYTQVGEYARAAALLRAEAAAQPLRESLSAALVLALQRAGRRSDALDWFHRTRRLLSEELGVDPGRELAEAYAVALRGDGDPAAEARAPVVPAVPESRPTPPEVSGHPETVDLLPRMPRGFHGRADELAALDRATAGETPVCLVTGPAGVGKTALVVHWAHRNRERFPGGLLYADLRGFSDTPEVEPAEVVREFLLALGVAPRRIPESARGASALFRSLAADRRLLVVLDNAPGSAPVQELLPGGARCVTVVTSRHRLPGLIASDAARPVPVDVLGPADSAALLAAVLGEERVRAEAGAARRLAQLCGGLPLALRVTAARLTDQPEWSLSALSGELSDESRRLALLDVEDTGVRAALRLTVRRLPADAAHHFAHLGRHPGTHVDRYAAAALAGTGPAAAEVALERLAAAHLVTRAAPDRWTLHDLVRLYARDLDADPDALLRALDHTVVTALAAADAAEPGDESCFPLPADVRTPREVRRFAAREEAMAWYEAEHEEVTLAAAAADAAGLHSRTWRLVLGLWPLIVWRVRDGWSPLLGTALEAARADGDLRAQSRILALLGWVLTEEGRVPEALAHLEAAPVLAARAGDRSAQATALVNLSLAQAALGSPQEAAEECADAARLARDAGDPYTERLALYHLTRHQLDCGAWEAALRTVAAAQALDEVVDASAAGRVLLVAAAGEALLGLGDEAAGTARLREAADAAEACGFDDGAVRALGVLLKGASGAELTTLRARYDRALARLQSRS